MVENMISNSLMDCTNLEDDFSDNHLFCLDDDLFENTDIVSRFEYDKMSWGAALCSVVAHKKKTRSEVAALLGVSRGRVSKILSGEENLTLKTISAITEALGLGVELSFINENNIKASQPWALGVTDVSIRAHQFNDRCRYLASRPYGDDVTLHLLATIDRVQTNQELNQIIASTQQITAAIEQTRAYQLPVMKMNILDNYNVLESKYE